MTLVSSTGLKISDLFISHFSQLNFQKKMWCKQKHIKMQWFQKARDISYYTKYLFIFCLDNTHRTFRNLIKEKGKKQKLWQMQNTKMAEHFSQICLPRQKKSVSVSGDTDFDNMVTGVMKRDRLVPYMLIIWQDYCDDKFFKIPKRDFIFARVKTGRVGTWSLVG